jgi:hypothetical protein
MACNIQRPTTAELFETTKSLFEANVLGGGSVIPESNEWFVVSTETALLQQMWSLFEQQLKDQDPATACCDALIKLAAARGVYPYPAKYAQGYVTITGVEGAALPDSLEFSINGQQYVSSGLLPDELPSASFTFLVRALIAGPASNIAAGADVTGSLDTIVPDIDNEVTLAGGRLCGGAEAESCEAFRTRYIGRRKIKPLARLETLMNKVLDEWPCVTRVCYRGGACCEIETEGCGSGNCSNEIKFYALFDDTFECGLAPTCVVDQITAWLFGVNQGIGEGEAPIGVCGTVYTATPATINVNMLGLACLTVLQQQEITDGIKDLFKTLCPSEILYISAVESIARSVVGYGEPVDVVFTSDSENVTFTECGDVEPECDVMPCLGTIVFSGEVINSEC